jgi:drug/metabolite transporter (DMT)-like permease
LNGLKHIASEKAAIISMLEPPLVMLVGYLLLDEKIATMQLCGALMILCAVLLVIIKSPSKKENFVQEHML